MKTSHYYIGTVVLALALLCTGVTAADLAPDGGYNIVVGISEDVQVEDRSTYIKNVKEMVTNFANLLRTSTKRVFHIKSVDILVPGSWAEELKPEIATKATYNSADVQVSGSFLEPKSVNYYPCGRSGLRIELPTGFVSDIDTRVRAARMARGKNKMDKSITLLRQEADNLYGSRSQAKVLLNLWLRYRFGVWEEHGYPGNHTVTPYVYQADPLGHTPWILTHCSNLPLVGEFRADKDPSIECDIKDGFTRMDSDCLFHLNTSHPGNKATSSLMNFHWLESNVQLCDKQTHNKMAPNRQNLYCNHRSVWEIIHESVDYQGLNQNQIDADYSTQQHQRQLPAEIKFRIVAPSSKPLLYILLDVVTPSDLVNLAERYRIWRKEVATFVQNLPSDVVATLVRYPNRDPDGRGLLRTSIDWSTMSTASKREVIKKLDVSEEETGGPGLDHRLALAEVVADLKTRNHPAGSVLLLLRTQLSPMDSMYGFQGVYEEDLALELQMHNIKLYGIEHNQRDKGHVWNASLVHLTRLAGGTSGMIQDEGETHILGQIRPVLASALDKLRQAPRPEPSVAKFDVLYRDSFFTSENTTIVIPARQGIGSLHVFVTVYSGRMDEVHFQWQNSNLDPRRHFLNFSERAEWNRIDENEPYRLGHVYFALLTEADLVIANDPTQSAAWELYLQVNSLSVWVGGNEAAVSVLIYTTRDSSTTATFVKAEISTSADLQKYFECSTTEVDEEPLAVYVKLTDQDNRPLLQLDQGSNNLTVNLINLLDARVASSALNDGGFGADLLAGDGVYSAYIYPAGYSWASCRLYVTLVGTEVNYSIPVEHIINPIGIPATVQQDNLEATVRGRTLATPYSVVLEAPFTIYVGRRCQNRKYIPRVTDTEAELTTMTDGDYELIRVKFRVPPVIKSDSTLNDFLQSVSDFQEVATYFVVMAHLIVDVNSSIDGISAEVEHKRDLQMFVVEMEPAGRWEELLIKRRNAYTVVALELVDVNQPLTKSTGSNFASVQALPKGKEPEGDPGTAADCWLACTPVGTAVLVGGATILLLLAVAAAFLWRKNRAQRALLSSEEVREFLRGKSGAVIPGGAEDGKSQSNEQQLACSEFIQSLPYDSKYEIPINKIHIDRAELLGSGTFGNVYKGYVVNLARAGKVLIVAVKTMKPNMDKLHFKAMLAEVKVMTHVAAGQHPNIVRLIGACTRQIRKCQVFLATEFCANGSLVNYLRTLNPKSNFQNLLDGQGLLHSQMVPRPEQRIDPNPSYANARMVVTTCGLIKWSREIASGMEYLGQKRIVHGDLAARNILLDSDLVAKISDFGLSKQAQALQQYSNTYTNPTETLTVEEGEEESKGGDLLPWKWLAPETLAYMKFSVASDVWAYGVTMWEIFSLGQIPYAGIQWSPDFVDKLLHGGLRMQTPDYASSPVYELMLDCWAADPSHRPGFCKIKDKFDRMLLTMAPGDYIYIRK